MRRDASTTDPLSEIGSVRPFLVLASGLVLIVLGAVLPGGAADGISVARGWLIAAGLVALGAACSERLRSASWDFEARSISAFLLVVASGGVFLAWAGTLEAWDSMRLALAVLASVTLAGAFLVILPSVARKVIVSLLIFAHFGGILVAVTSVPPPNSSPPWLSQQAFAYFYRPYNAFMYLNNAYHFYAPEPGPPTLVWFFIRYTDDSTRWVKIPSRQDSPVPLHYQRMLALTESVNSINRIPPANYNDLARARMLAGNTLFDPPIPLPNDLPTAALYNPPDDYSARTSSAYARYVAKHWPHPDDNLDAGVATIKVYRVIHNIIDAKSMGEGISPHAKIWDRPYFMGEFDTKGTLLDPNDPFLYWLIPLTWEQKQPEPGKIQGPEFIITDHLQTHAMHKSAYKTTESKP